jgi:hypothetical protein
MMTLTVGILVYGSSSVSTPPTEPAPKHLHFKGFEVNEYRKRLRFKASGFPMDHVPSSEELLEHNVKFFDHGIVIGYSKDNSTLTPVLAMRFTPFDVMDAKKLDKCRQFSMWLNKMGRVMNPVMNNGPWKTGGKSWVF